MTKFPSIVRFTDVLESIDNLFVQKIISGKDYKIHQSTSNSVSQFFSTDLTESEIDFFFQKFKNCLFNYISSNLGDKKAVFERAYINCHPAFHPGDWHVDSVNGITALYYPESKIEFINEGGLDFKDYGYYHYIPNSLIIFPGSIEHMAVHHTKIGVLRFSIAFKWNLNS